MFCLKKNIVNAGVHLTMFIINHFFIWVFLTNFILLCIYGFAALLFIFQFDTFYYLNNLDDFLKFKKLKTWHFKNTQTTLDGTDVKSTQEIVPSLPKTKIEKKINEEVRKMMGEIFACIERELIEFIQHHERMDST